MANRFDELPDELTILGAEGGEADEFMECAIGAICGGGIADRVCYDMEKVIQVLMQRNDWDYEEAREYFLFNILDGAGGDSAPVYMWLFNVGHLLNEEKDAERPGTVTDRS